MTSQTFSCHNIKDTPLLSLVTVFRIVMWWSYFRPVVPPHLILNHRHRRYKAPIVLQKPRRGFNPRNKMLSKYWFEQHKSRDKQNSLCSGKWIRKWCRSVLIDVWAVHDDSAPAGYTSQCIQHHYIFIGTLMQVYLQPCMQHVIVLRLLRQCALL